MHTLAALLLALARPDDPAHENGLSRQRRKSHLQG
jgi:hypothetical protein